MHSTLDDFTDEVLRAALECRSPALMSAVRFRVEYVYETGEYRLTVPTFGGGLGERKVNLDFRAGRRPAFSFTATQRGRSDAFVPLTDALLEQFVGELTVYEPDVLIYRIEKGSTRRVPLPAEGMPVLIEEFRRRAPVPSLEEIEEDDRSRFDFDFLTKLADGGDVGAMEELGRRYRYGIGVTADLAVAIEWFRMAAALASMDGIVAYSTYLDIIEKHGPEAEEINREIMLHDYGESLTESLAWFDIAAACHQGAVEFRDALVGVLGPVRVERAQERAAELRVKGAILTDPVSCDRA